ncbi:hypothetical protein H5410_059868 [Solanum commersonii]|uniref:Uncharacterized protein n=1 Tax=Solanum commersonii TaxID=4109 RepID=A0A9J5W4S4_SOLCO|nr:hypothetical protein H5410_059868 [Solanum commersonii]
MELHHFIILIWDTVNKVVASCAKASPDEIVSTLVNIYNESVRSPEWGGNDEVDKIFKWFGCMIQIFILKLVCSGLERKLYASI